MIIVICPHPVKRVFKVFYLFLLDFGIEKKLLNTPLFVDIIVHIFPASGQATAGGVFMSPKELLYIDDALGHEQFLIAQCGEAESALDDPQLKQCVRQLQNAHQQIFNRLMALI